MSKFVTELMQDFASKEYAEGYAQVCGFSFTIASVL